MLNTTAIVINKRGIDFRFILVGSVFGRLFRRPGLISQNTYRWLDSMHSIASNIGLSIDVVIKLAMVTPKQSYCFSWWIIDRYRDLNIFTELYGQAKEVERLHFTNGEQWPKISQLQSEYIPPFVEDAIWEKRGKLQWHMFPYDRDEVHQVAYVGRTSDPKIASSFILLFEHYHTLDGAYYIGVNKEKAYTVWIKPGEVTIPSDFSQGALIKDGWFQVVAYTGSNELKKLNRGK